MNTLLKRFLQFVPDKPYICLQYFRSFHRFPDLKNPKTFTEKLQWNKLYDRNPIYTVMADKILVKDYVGKIIGPEYIIPTLKIWQNVNDISLEDLPDKFIIKCNHNSHSKALCTNKSTFDLDAVKKELGPHLHANGFWYGREWPYKNITPCVFAEQLLESPDGDLKDYKVMCFNGKAKLVMLNSNRFLGELEEAIYDLEWNKTDITQGYTSSKTYPKPENFEEMIQLSELLAKDISHVRVDWYNINGQLFFGEMTFFDGSGFVPFDNPEHDLLLGSWVSLGEKHE